MSTSAALATTFEPASEPASESLKRQQILDGARHCFLAHGFDGASMNEIVKSAGVSKATVYAYFPSKEKLFETLIYEDRRRQVEQTVVIPSGDGPIEVVLEHLATRLMGMVQTRESIEHVRMVIGVAGKFPEIGRAFYAAGPAYAVDKVAAYFQRRMDDGTLRPGNPQRLATQFVDLVLAGFTKPYLFGVPVSTDPAYVQDSIKSAVDMFLNGVKA
jgi:AcrR family transcriptional regulator